MSKAHKLYILVGITWPIAVSTIVSALSAGYPLDAGIFGFLSVSWSVFALYLAWEFFRPKKTDKTHRATEVTPRHKRLMLFERTVFLFVLLIAIALLFIVIIGGSRLYFALGASWWIVVSGGHLFYVSLVPFYVSLVPDK